MPRQRLSGLFDTSAALLKCNDGFFHLLDPAKPLKKDVQNFLAGAFYEVIEAKRCNNLVKSLDDVLRNLLDLVRNEVEEVRNEVFAPN